MNERLEKLQNRVSHSMRDLTKVSITDAQWDNIFKAVASAPDYGSLLPYKFYVFQGESFESFLEDLKNSRMAEFPEYAETIEKKMELMAKSLSAFVIVSHTHNPDANKTAHDQLCATVCASAHFYLALNTMDLGSVWVSAKGDEPDRIAKEFNFADTEYVSGMFMVGGIVNTTPKQRPKPEEFVKFM